MVKMARVRENGKSERFYCEHLPVNWRLTVGTGHLPFVVKVILDLWILRLALVYGSPVS